MFLPENIDLAHSEKYSLSIRLVPDGFSFCIYNPTDASVFHFQETTFGKKLSYLENIQKLIFDYGFFTQPFNNTYITVVSPDFTLVPDGFYDKKKEKELFRFNLHDKSGTVLSDASEIGDFKLLYELQEDLHSFLSRNVWNPCFGHHSTKLISAFAQYKTNEKSKRCFVDFHDNLISVLCFDGDKLLSVNTLPNTGSSNTLYFIASIWEQLPLDQLKDQLFISGKTEPQREVIDTLKKLIKNVSFTEITPKLALTEEQKKSVPTDLLVQL